MDFNLMKRRRLKPFSILLDLLIDSALIGMGLLFYYHFEVQPLGPFGLSPILIDLFGSRHTAVLVISLVPFVIGGLNFLQTIFRILTAPWKRTQNEG
jgi:hypothetical protein